MARRRRVVGEREVPLVTYLLSGGLEVTHWNPVNCFSIGDAVEVEVHVRAYQGRQGVRYSLQIPSDDGSF